MCWNTVAKGTLFRGFQDRAGDWCNGLSISRSGTTYLGWLSYYVLLESCWRFGLYVVFYFKVMIDPLKIFERTSCILARYLQDANNARHVETFKNNKKRLGRWILHLAFLHSSLSVFITVPYFLAQVLFTKPRDPCIIVFVFSITLFVLLQDRIVIFEWPRCWNNTRIYYKLRLEVGFVVLAFLHGFSLIYCGSFWHKSVLK